MTTITRVEASPVNRRADQDAPPAIAIDRLTKTFGKGPPAVRAVRDVSLAVPAGQVFALLGPNGAGKTTLIKMLCGLVTPTSGSARLNGYDIGRRRSAAVLQLGAVLEGGRNVYWSMTASQNLLYFGRLKGLRGDEIKPRAGRLLRELGLWERRDQLVGAFSRGMQQKVAVAAALVADPPIVLLDEPTIGLDVEAARTVKAWVVRLAHEAGKTVVLTTHQLDMAQELADRVAIIGNGRIRADLPVGELLAQFREDRYRITLGAPLDGAALSLPEGALVGRDDGVTTVIAPFRTQRDLYALLDRLRDADLPLVSVAQIEPDLEDVFLRIVERHDDD